MRKRAFELFFAAVCFRCDGVERLAHALDEERVGVAVLDGAVGPCASCDVDGGLQRHAAARHDRVRQFGAGLPSREGGRGVAVGDVRQQFERQLPRVQNAHQSAALRLARAPSLPRHGVLDFEFDTQSVARYALSSDVSRRSLERDAPSRPRLFGPNRKRLGELLDRPLERDIYTSLFKSERRIQILKLDAARALHGGLGHETRRLPSPNVQCRDVHFIL